MESVKKNPMYYSASDKELIKMWEDINGNNIESLCRSLLKKIASHAEDPALDEEDILDEKQMRGVIGKWEPFSLWGAHFIVNVKKEYVQVRIKRPLAIQPEYGPVLTGWQSIDSSSLNEQLNQFKSFSDFQAFAEMIKQDHQEYKDEGRYQELPGWKA